MERGKVKRILPVIVAASAVPVLAVNILYQDIQRKKKQRNRTLWSRYWLQRRDQRGHTVVHLYKEFVRDGDLEELQKTLRMPLPVYCSLLERLRPHITKMNTSWRPAVSAETRLCLTLIYLALGHGFAALAQDFRVAISTARDIVKHTCDAIHENMKSEYLRTPSTVHEWKAVADQFNTRWNFPHCIGAVDGKHVRFIAPPGSGSSYINYKGFFSIVLMAVVSADYRFIFVNVGAEGRSSDGGIWAHSAMKDYMEDTDNPLNLPEPEPVQGMEGEIPYILVGDEGFALNPNLMKPFPSYGASPREKVFNYRLSRARRIVENAFGILATHFRLFLRALEMHPENCEKLVMAACILHNFLTDQGGPDYMSQGSVDQEGPDGVEVEGEWRQEGSLLTNLQQLPPRNATDYAKKLRRKYASYFVSEAGELPWQYGRHQ